MTEQVDRLEILETNGHGDCLEAVLLRGPTPEGLRDYLALHEGKDTKHVRRAQRKLHEVLHPKSQSKKGRN